MNCVITGASVIDGGKLKRQNVFIDNGIVSEISDKVPHSGHCVLNFNNCVIFPGFIDVHVHLREPGFLYKETVKTGTAAAARGGYSAVCAMPNLSPVPDCRKNLDAELDAIKKGAKISVYPYGAVTVCEMGEKLSDMENMAKDVVGFSDDGRGVQSETLMEEALLRAKSLEKIIASHCEDNALLLGGYIHKGKYAKEHGHLGICSESEWKPILRDIKLLRKTGAAEHICHISTKESVEIIRRAKAEGLDITCETAPHYLTLCDDDLEEDGKFKMNPPLRSREDKEALIKGIADGTIDMIATDHAPHSKEEKSKGLKDSLMGISGIETAFSVLYTSLVKNGDISLERLIALLSDNPSKRFKIPGGLKVGKAANLTVFDLNEKYKIDSREFLSKGKSTPFDGKEVFGRCLMTISDGKIAYIREGKSETRNI